jgi:hypothetical protein
MYQESSHIMPALKAACEHGEIGQWIGLLREIAVLMTEVRKRQMLGLFQGAPSANGATVRPDLGSGVSEQESEMGADVGPPHADCLAVGGHAPRPTPYGVRLARSHAEAQRRGGETGAVSGQTGMSAPQQEARAARTADTCNSTKLVSPLEVGENGCAPSANAGIGAAPAPFPLRGEEWRWSARDALFGKRSKWICEQLAAMARRSTFSRRVCA